MYARLLTCLTAAAVAVHGQLVFPDSNRYTFGQPGFVLHEDSGQTISFDSETPSNAYQSNVIQDSTYSQSNGISRGMNRFNFDVSRAILNKMADVPSENIVLSPLSLAGAMSLLILGSSGKTYNELAHLLGYFNDESNSKYVHGEFGNLLDKIVKRGNYGIFDDRLRNISFANALFLQEDYPIARQYENVVKNVYRSEVKHVNFKSYGSAARDLINRWVQERTFGKIQNILPFTPPIDTRLIIANALYFRAEWDKYFMSELTKRSLFTPDKRYPEQKISVDMMANVGNFSYLSSPEYGCMIVGLPYKGGRTTLYAIKPLNSVRKSLKDILNGMTPEIFDYLIKNARMQSTIVLFPKMKLTSTTSMKTVFEDMGVRTLFSRAEADLKLIDGDSAQESKDNLEDVLIFTRFGDDGDKSDGCDNVFNSKSAGSVNCTRTEVIDGKTVNAVYKRIGDKVGRRIYKRQTGQNYNLYVDEIVHKVEIDITETGTEAVASTLVLITKDGRRPTFVADEPFFFVIRDEDTGLPLFSSAVYRPS